MADDPSHAPPGSGGEQLGWSALGYLIAGIAVWGGAGWLVDQWLGLPHIGLLVGMIGGMGAAVYLIVKKLGQGE